MKRMMNVKVFSNKLYRFIWVGLGYVLVIWIGIINYWTGPVFSSLAFYLVPVIIMIWYVGRPAGMLISIAGALTWLLTNLIFVPSYPPHIIIPVWNLAEKLSVYFLVVYILLRLSKKEEALRFEHNQFLSILDTTDAFISIVDPKSYEIIYANSALMDLWGAGMLGKKCYEVLQGLVQPCDFCTNKFILGENVGKTYVWEHQDRRSQRWFRCIDRAIKWPDGRLVRYEMAVDISASKQLEKERRNLLSMFAHDMKNPILIAEGFLSRVYSGKAGPLTDKQLNHLRIVNDAVNRVGKFITNFLEFSRIESGEYKTIPVPFDLAMSIEKNLESLRIEAEKKGIQLIFEVIEGRTAIVHANVTQIDRVLVNLLDNSIKYTNSGGAITVALSNRDKDFLVQVADTGTGIPEEHLPYLFNPFYRVTGDSKGSGLGLAIVKTIVEANGGRIWVNSTYGKGSTFAFTLPKYLGEISSND
jgi:two-component system, OmpR family, phosphate regulon sensor histidine kinase PhoR